MRVRIGVAIMALAVAVGSVTPIAGSANAAMAKLQPSVEDASTAARDAGARDASSTSLDIRKTSFQSASLGRAMPYSIYLPPDYGKSTKRYSVLYMLHGMSGTNQEWQSYGIFERADAMIRAGQLQPLIIVLPQGDRAYWVDHALTDHEAWGRYMAQDVVNEIDAKYRTVADGIHRAIGGVSMGAHGAVQLAMNYPGTFAVVGAHSLVLRRYDSAPAFFGLPVDYAKRDPMTLAPTKMDVLRSLDLWIDIGDRDPWAKLAQQFVKELADLKVAHAWHEWSGDHSASYWSAHLDEYLRFYGDALSRPARLRHLTAPSLSFS